MTDQNLIFFPHLQESTLSLPLEAVQSNPVKLIGKKTI